MIDNIKNVPEIYSKRSKDFKLFLKLLDVVVNAIKFNTDKLDDIYNSNACPERFLEFLSSFYSFNPNIKFTDEELRWMLTGFGAIVKNKGTYLGLAQAISLVMKSQSISAPFYVDIFNDVERDGLISSGIITPPNKDSLTYYIELQVGEEVSRCSLLELLEYVKPVGYSIGIQAVKQEEGTLEVYVKDKVRIFKHEGQCNKVDHTHSNNDPNCTDIYIKGPELVSRVTSDQEDLSYDTLNATKLNTMYINTLDRSEIMSDVIESNTHIDTSDIEDTVITVKDENI